MGELRGPGYSAGKDQTKLSFLLLSLEIGLFLWRWKNPILLHSLNLQSILYVLLVLSMFFVVSMIGWFGASLTFPIEKPETENQ